MDIQTLILILFLTIGAMVSLGYYLSTQIKKLKEDLKSDDESVLVEWLKDMKSSVDKSSDVLERQLKGQREAMNNQTKLIWERLGKSEDVIRNVQKQLGGIQEFGTDIKDLSNILKSPKLRGGLGEQFLYEILENSLPHDLFKTQFKFKDGSVCDAVIKTDRGLIPIDSKFPMENFKLMITKETQEERDRVKKVFIRDVKKRIDEISQKYILPEENTVNFAVMYVPAENVYYELIVNTPEIEAYARKKDIFITSPNTLSYQVKAILVAYQQTELQKHSGEILKALAGIKVEAGKFSDDLGVLERHITNSYKVMDLIKSKFLKLFGKIESVQEIESPKDSHIISSAEKEPKRLSE